MLRLILDLIDEGHYDLANYLREAKQELGDKFELGYTIGQYFEYIVNWEWQGNRLVYEDRKGHWHVVPDGAKTYVGFGK